ncbi:putative olfactory receptor 14L1 [Tachyglossus aculeatus]|uniref:putative olfactory receptor 14L1 n=1 Tax=Tachyglossus aculeatus TaxID=9261 RepID=UPI0018F681EF|nr:putative olfactory receptor 14L1 [Tachyglossus aculeatus]
MAVMEFLLLGFSEVRELQLVHATLFLLVYLAALTGNLLIVAVTTLDQRLHTPMYFFLKNLSILDLCLISVTVPESFFNSVTNNNSISFKGCVLQVFFFVSAVFSEVVLLTVMSYDRYAAICHPLHYEAVMNRGVCGKMAAASWLSGGLSGLMHTAAIFSEPFSGPNVIHQFFCDVPQLLKLSGPQGNIYEYSVIVLSASSFAISFAYIATSYVCIFSAVLRMPSAEGRSKAFSTCLPHLIVVTFFVSTGVSEYLIPSSNCPSGRDLLLSVFYSMVPPALNPVIYSLRNQAMKAALGRMLCLE